MCLVDEDDEFEDFEAHDAAGGFTTQQAIDLLVCQLDTLSYLLCGHNQFYKYHDFLKIHCRHGIDNLRSALPLKSLNKLSPD